LVTKCVTGDFLRLTFNDVGRGRGGQKVLSRPSADSFAVGRRQKSCRLSTLLPRDSNMRVGLKLRPLCREMVSGNFNYISDVERTKLIEPFKTTSNISLWCCCRFIVGFLLLLLSFHGQLYRPLQKDPMMYRVFQKSLTYLGKPCTLRRVRTVVGCDDVEV
jgi:hypothetical protein